MKASKNVLRFRMYTHIDNKYTKETYHGVIPCQVLLVTASSILLCSFYSSLPLTPPLCSPLAVSSWAAWPVPGCGNNTSQSWRQSRGRAGPPSELHRGHTELPQTCQGRSWEPCHHIRQLSL